jgi:hypothetical protein
MDSMRFCVAVDFQRIPVVNRWIDERWEPVALVPDAAQGPSTRPPLRIGDDATGTRWRFSGLAIELHRSEGEGYFLNLAAPEPKAFVMWRRRETSPTDGTLPPIEPRLVTVSYNEAARLLDGGETVDALPLPDGIRAWMEPFVAENYKPEPRKKMRRNDPFRDEQGPRR